MIYFYISNSSNFMNNSMPRLLIFCFSLINLGFLVSCESYDIRKEQIGVTFDEATLIPKQLELAIAKHPAWKLHWASQIGDFKSSDFSYILTDSIFPMEMPEKNPIQISDPLFPYQFVHPKGIGTIDIYSYKIEIPENRDDPYYNPDSEVIWYREDGMRERLLFMGPSGLFEEGSWLNEDEFLVFGFLQEEKGFRPMAWILNVKKYVMKQFQLEKTIAEYDFQSYIAQKIKLEELN